MSLLHVDPTRTTLLRGQFALEMRKRFAQVKRDVNQLVLMEDAFGLKERFTFNTRWAFASSPEQAQRFREWVDEEVQTQFFNAREGEDVWWENYIVQGYRRGKQNTQSALPANLRDSGTPFYSPYAFQTPISVERFKLLAGRSYTDLKGITDAMSQQMSRVLVDGMIRGDNPRVIAKLLNERVDKIGIVRAQALARTEIIRAHAEGALDEMARMGVEQVGVHVEWTTAANPCPICKQFQGMIMTIAEARGRFPAHPNCRCSPIPIFSNSGIDKNRSRIIESMEAALSTR